MKCLAGIFLISLKFKTGIHRGHKQLFLTHEDELMSVMVPDEFWYAQHQVINLTTKSTVHRVADMKAYSSVKRRQGDGQLIVGPAGYLIWASTLPG